MAEVVLAVNVPVVHKNTDGCKRYLYRAYYTQRKLQLLEHFKYAEPELAKTVATRLLLWNEYLAKHPGGYQTASALFFLLYLNLFRR